MWFQLEYGKYFLFMLINLNLNTLGMTMNCSSIESSRRKINNYDEFYYVVDQSYGKGTVHFCHRFNSFKTSFELMCNKNNHWYKRFLQKMKFLII